MASGLLGSVAFNEFPLPLHISATRETNRPFFRQLEAAASAEEATALFEDYMKVVFGLDENTPPYAPRRYRSSYLRLLKGWGYDSNSRE